MLLAEALQERADLNRAIAQLRVRIQSNALVQEGETPAENPERLLSELDGALERLEYLIAAINHTNSVTRIDGETLTALIARKDALRLREGAYREIVHTASQSTSRARNTEIRIRPALDAAALQKKTDALAKKLRELDNRIQQCNWTTQLIEP